MSYIDRFLVSCVINWYFLCEKQTHQFLGTWISNCTDISTKGGQMDVMMDGGDGSVCCLGTKTHTQKRFFSPSKNLFDTNQNNPNSRSLTKKKQKTRCCCCCQCHSLLSRNKLVLVNLAQKVLKSSLLSGISLSLTLHNSTHHQELVPVITELFYHIHLALREHH